jgi:phosphoribosylglycinamide formyltransferase-1
MGKKLALGVLVSGSGTNLQAILDAIHAGSLDAEVRLVISNQPGALALGRAAASAVPTSTIPHRDFSSREAFDEALVAALRKAGVEWVVLAGFMRLITSRLLGAFPNRILNIHPALLPAFPGVASQEQALAYGVKVTGCTVHLVDEGTDTGPIVAQRAVEVLDGDDPETLKARLLVEEHRLLVEVLQRVAAGKLEIEEATAGRRGKTRFLP